ncbi:hypothetical protein EG329_011739 [Mollisiaceae sp. DMI_Dod_QoI]|nr:hypothetical protein EG329_011739 [Helotiales sp. DMI_Dod_QoI]
MGKRKKTADRAGKAPPPRPKPSVNNDPKDKIEVDDSESDAGSFMDDDTVDFLPTAWTGKVKKGALNKKDGSREIQEDDENGYQNCYPAEESVVISVVNSVAAMSIKKNTPVTVIESRGYQHTVSPADHVELAEPKTVMISRHEVPSSLLRKPRTATEELQAELLYLKHKLDKKEKDVKAAKQQTAATKSELTACQKENQTLLNQAKALRHEKIELKAQCRQLQVKIDEHAEIVEVLESEHNEELKDQRKQAKKELRLEAFKTKKAQSEVHQLTSEGKDQQSTIAHLRNELVEKTAAHRNLQVSLQQEQQNNNDMHDRCALLNVELTDLRGELVGERERNRRGPSFEDLDLRRRYSDISNQLVQAKQQSNSLKENVRKLKNEKAALEVSLDEAKDNLYYAKKSEDQLTIKLMIEKSRVSRLEQDIEDQQPLVDVGADIRLRFLEQAREAVFDISKRDIDMCLIKDGNEAAHRANGEQDAALFTCKLIPEENYDDLCGVFAELYDTPPSKFPCYSPKMERLTDCAATAKILKFANDSNNAASKRLEHDVVKEELTDMYNYMQEHEFESSVRVSDLLDELERLNDKIITLYRPKNGRR